jgi:hypothetical protein
MAHTIVRNDIKPAHRIAFYSFLVGIAALAVFLLNAVYVESKLYIEIRNISTSLDRIERVAEEYRIKYGIKNDTESLDLPYASSTAVMFEEFSTARRSFAMNAADISLLTGIKPLSCDQYDRLSWDSIAKNEKYAGYERLYHLAMKFDYVLREADIDTFSRHDSDEAIGNIRTALADRGLAAPNFWTLMYKAQVARYSLATPGDFK